MTKQMRRACAQPRTETLLVALPACEEVTPRPTTLNLTKTDNAINSALMSLRQWEEQPVTPYFTEGNAAVFSDHVYYLQLRGSLQWPENMC